MKIVYVCDKLDPAQENSCFLTKKLFFPKKTVMSLEEAVLEKLRDLSPQQQKEVLDFAEFLQQKNVKSSSDKPKELKDISENCQSISMTSL